MAHSPSFDATGFGKQLALGVFQNPMLRVFIAEEVSLLQQAGVPQLGYHEERVIFAACAAAFSIRAYLGSNPLADSIWDGYATFWREYGASAPDRHKAFQLLEKRLSGYGFAATLDLMPERKLTNAESISELAKTFLNAINEHSADPKAAENLLLFIAQKFGIPLWEQQVSSTGKMMKTAGLPVEER